MATDFMTSLIIASLIIGVIGICPVIILNSVYFMVTMTLASVQLLIEQVNKLIDKQHADNETNKRMALIMKKLGCKNIRI